MKQELKNMFLALLISAMIASTSCGPISSMVQGTPEGFALGTTGGGNGTPIYPKEIDELKYILNQSKPAVVVIDREFNFIGSEGLKTEVGCQVSDCGSKGQDALPNQDWCGTRPKLNVTSDIAAHRGIVVKGSKTLIGIGSSAVFRGKGIRIRGNNVIIQNIAITELNPQYIFGGDAIDIDSSDQIWIDRVSVSKIGRQFMVTGHGKSGRITVSNCNFDGRTEHSSSCNNQHYWGFLFLGSDDRITMMNNNLSYMSGRGPKVGGMPTANVLVHAVNNTWLNCDGHAFDLEVGGQALIEGNSFNGVKEVIYDRSKGGYLLMDELNINECVSLGLGRPCAPNKFDNCMKPNITGTCKPKFDSYTPPATISYTPPVVKSNDRKSLLDNLKGYVSASAGPNSLSSVWGPFGIILAFHFCSIWVQSL